MGLWASQIHISHCWSLSEQKLAAAALGRGVGYVFRETAVPANTHQQLWRRRRSGSNRR